jgi:hypothetical protein
MPPIAVQKSRHKKIAAKTQRHQPKGVPSPEFFQSLHLFGKNKKRQAPPVDADDPGLPFRLKDTREPPIVNPTEDPDLCPDTARKRKSIGPTVTA